MGSTSHAAEQYSALGGEYTTQRICTTGVKQCQVTCLRSFVFSKCSNSGCKLVSDIKIHELTCSKNVIDQLPVHDEFYIISGPSAARTFKIRHQRGDSEFSM